MEQNTTALTGQATDEQVAKWKQQYPLGIFAVKKEGRIAYFKIPGFEEQDCFHDLRSEEGKKVSDGWKDLAGLLFIGGDEELIKSPRYLGNVVRRIEDAMIGEKAELVNL